MRLFSSKTAVVVGGLVLALVILAPPRIQGSEWDLLTIFSVNHQIQVPGKVLEPNTKYAMKLLDLQGSRNVVQIFNEDRTQLLTTFMAISAYRLEPADKTVFTFYEVESGYAKPIDKWFYPGRLNGLEFLYPKDQAAEIALHAPGRQLNIQVAQTTVTEPEAEIAASPTPAPEEEQTAPMTTEPEITREKPSEVPSTVDENKTEEAPAVTETKTERLPKTAGELPLVGLIGMLCFGFGLGLKVLSARS